MSHLKHDFKRTAQAAQCALAFADIVHKRPRREAWEACDHCTEDPAAALLYKAKRAETYVEPLHVSDMFDGGNIEVDAMHGDVLDLKIRRDPFCSSDDTSHAQWFYFKVTGAKRRALEMNIINAGEASFPEAWPGTRAVASYDLDDWFRISTEWVQDKGVLRLKQQCERQAMWVAFFAPYDLHRHAALIARMQMRDRVTLHVLGCTLDGRDLELLQVGEACEHRRAVWIIHRQHPGETMAEWFAEGLLERLTNPEDAVARALLNQAVVYVVPNMNPDGSFRGYLRTNAAGANLNREWGDPTMERSPEVYLVREMLKAWGCDIFLDIHGDEELPVVFTAGAEGIPSWNPTKQQQYEVFQAAFKHAAPVYQTELGYERDANGMANMGIACNWAAEKQQCLSMTLEMPFKDAMNAPDVTHGWSIQRSKQLGNDILPAILEALPLLGKQQPGQDAAGADQQQAADADGN